jgi:exopolysaccharide biosynthesis protein
VNKKFVYLIGISLGFLLASSSYSQAINNSFSQIRFDISEQGNSIVHTITIPYGSTFKVYPEVAPELQSIETFATQHKAIAVINGGYFDPKNQKTTSYITRKGKLVADPRTNERLIENPDLQLYLDKILNRTEFRRYICSHQFRYDITFHKDGIPSGCILVDAIGGGPQILPQNTAFEEGFTDYQAGEKIRDAIGTTQPNARSAIAITNNGDIILAMVAQKPESPSNSGMSLEQLADFLASLGVEKAINLDGGSSASLFYSGKTFYGRLDSEGNQIQRPIKSVILVR